MPWLRHAINLLLLAALARYVALCFFIHPFADDLSYAAIGMRTDLFARLGDEYYNWNGRWFSNALVLRGPLVLGIGPGLLLYRCVPILLLLFAWLSARTLIRAAAPLLRGSDASLGAAWFLLLFLQLMPDLSEGVFWYTGAVSYLLPGAGLLWLLALFIPAIQSRWAITWPRAAGMGLLGAAIAGSNELHMVLMVMGIGSLLLARARSGHRFSWKLAGVALPVAASALVMLLAPGNEARAAAFAARHEVGRTLLWGALQSGRFLVTWLASPSLLLASALFLAGLQAWQRAAGGLSARLPRPWIIVVALCGVLYVSMALPYWATGMLGQHRTVNAILLALLPGWFVLLASLREWLLAKRRWMPMPAAMRHFAITLLLSAFFATGNGACLGSDLLSGRLQRFDAELRSRYAAVITARDAGARHVELPRLSDPPASIRFLDAGADSEEWMNRSLANYLGADSVRITVR